MQMKKQIFRWFALARLTREEDGQDLIEYALLAALVALAATASIQSLGQEINVVFNTITGNLTNAI
jgi:pilus assembly protein Flp/PilA